MLGESLGKLDRVFLLISLVGALSFGIVMWRSDIILRYFLEKSDGQVIGHIVNVKKDTCGEKKEQKRHPCISRVGKHSGKPVR